MYPCLKFFGTKGSCMSLSCILVWSFWYKRILLSVCRWWWWCRRVFWSFQWFWWNLLNMREKLLIDNCPDNNNHPPKLSEKKLSCGISRRNPVNSQNREGTCEPWTGISRRNPVNSQRCEGIWESSTRRGLWQLPIISARMARKTAHLHRKLSQTVFDSDSKLQKQRLLEFDQDLFFHTTKQSEKGKTDSHLGCQQLVLIAQNSWPYQIL